MDDSIKDVRRDIEQTRARLSDTLQELDHRVESVKSAVTRNVNPMPQIRAHPWLALGLALGAGVAIGMSGADRKAATAAKQGAKKAGPAIAGGTKAAARGIKGMMSGDRDEPADARSAISGNRLAAYGISPELTDVEERPHSSLRVLDAIRDTIEARIEDVTNSLLDASRELLTGARRPSGI